MTNIEITLPDDLARRAREAGLLSDAAIGELLEEAMRRQAGKRLVEIAERLHQTEIPAMSMDEIDAEIRAVRAERRVRRQGSEPSNGKPGGSADRS
jgi:hypothetical protein